MDALEVCIVCISDVPRKRGGKGKDGMLPLLLDSSFSFWLKEILLEEEGKAFTLFISSNETEGEQGLQNKKNSNKSLIWFLSQVFSCLLP